MPPNRPRLDCETSPFSLFSLVTYLWSTNQQRPTSTFAPPAYSKLPTICTTPVSHNTLSRIPEDEEACFCGEYPPHYFDEIEEEEEADDDCCCGFANVFALAIYLGMIVIMVLNLDLLLSRWGVGVGMVPFGTATQQGSKMVFCRTYAGTGRSTYRLLSSDHLNVCAGDSITLFTDLSDNSAFKIGDGILFGMESENTATEKQTHQEMGNKFHEDVKTDNEEMEEPNDDLAQEGELSQPLPSPPTVPVQESSMHAGFGGPWRVKRSRTLG